MKKTVSYRKTVYFVKSENFCLDDSLYCLESRFSGGSSFIAKKSDCIEVFYSERLGKFVTIPEALDALNLKPSR